MENKIKEVIIKLVNNKELKLFGYILYSFEFELIETNDRIKEYNDFSYIIYDEKNNNIKLQIDKYFVETHDVQDIIVLILHNILHILNKHNLRKKDYDPNIFNLAADHIINLELSKEFKLPKEFILFKEIQNKNLTTEEVYNWILTNFNQESEQIEKNNSSNIDDQNNQNKNSNINNQNKNSNINNQNNSSNTDDQNNSSNTDDQNDLSNTDDQNDSSNTDEKNNQNKDSNINNKINETSENNKNLQNKNNKLLKVSKFTHKNDKSYIVKNIDNIEQLNNTEENNQIIDNIKRNCQLLINDDRFNQIKGERSNSLIEYIRNIIEVEIPWYKLLEKALLTKIKKNLDSRSWSNIMKRYKAHNILLPGYGIKKELEAIGLIFDTSGSISKKNLEIFKGIINNSISEFEKIWILQHDVKIQLNIIINQNDSDIIDNIKFKGRGGTSHYYVFHEIEKVYLKQEIKYSNLNLGLLIFITDFESDIIKYWNKFEWQKHIPVIFMLTNNKCKIPKEIEENVIYIKDII